MKTAISLFLVTALSCAALASGCGDDEDHHHHHHHG